MWQNRTPLLISLACIVFFVISAALSVHGTNSDWDDASHLIGGLAQWQTGQPRLNADHPPLARLIGALPALFIPVPPVADVAARSWQTADITGATAQYINIVEDKLLWPGRLVMLIFSVVLAGLLHTWGTLLLGPRRAWLPVVLFVFCPPLLANAPLVTTDMPISTLIFAAIFSWWRYLQLPKPGRLLWVCLSVGLGLATKHSALILPPLLLALGVITIHTPGMLAASYGRRWALVLGGLAAMGVASLFIVDAVYFFDGLFLTPSEYADHAQGLVPSYASSAAKLAAIWPEWLPLPLPFHYLGGVLAVLANVGEHGHATYFLGQAGYGGWPNYFLMLLLVKLPLTTLLLVGLGASKAFQRLPRDWWNLLFVALPPLLLIWIGSTGKMQIGIRHILPALPFLLLLAGYALDRVWHHWRNGVVIVLAGLSGLSTLAIHPDYLMYFNFLGGGPEQGWRISVTGDDYGQGDSALRDWLEARGVKEVAYGGFGWGSHLLTDTGITLKPLPCQDTGELVAVHLGQLLLTYNVRHNQCYAWMRMKEPDEKIGYSIFLYNSKNLKPLDVDRAHP